MIVCCKILITTYCSYDIVNVAHLGLLKVNTHADDWKIGVRSAILQSDKPQWSAVSFIERLWIHVIKLGHPLATLLRHGVVLHARANASCIIARTQLCSALPKPASCI